MDEIPKKPQRQRKRVPIACLNCKKRKVKCDKGRPSCGGCIRNGVAELCEYLEPSWANNNSNNSLKEGLPSISDGFVQDHGKIQVQEQLIELQKREIEELKKQLEVIKNSAGGSTITRDLPENDGMYILDKLNPQASISSRSLDVSNDNQHTVASTKYVNNEFIDIYSWINVIKLDPQLTKLWYKITNLQKAYHLFKKNMSEMKLESGMNVKSKSPIDSNPSVKKNDYRVNEIDFTYALGTSGQQDEIQRNKCPVIECGFNFMVEDKQKSNGETLFGSKNTPITLQSTPLSLSASEPQYVSSLNELADTPIIKQCPFKDTPQNVSVDSLISWNNENKIKDTVFILQNMWDSILCLCRGNDKLNHKQLYFLMDFYFNSNQFEIESRNLFKFYKSEIQKIILRNGDTISLNIQPFGIKVEEHETLTRLNSQGIYLSMLALIIEESLDILRQVARLDLMSDLTIQFQILFPAEIVYLTLGYKNNNILGIIQEFLLGLKDESQKVDKLRPSLSGITCCVGLLNREIANNKKQASKPNTKSNFSGLFVLLMNTFLSEDNSLEIWKDPKMVNFSNESKRRNTDLKAHFCYLWYSIIRLANIVTFKFISPIKHLGRYYSIIKNLYGKIAASEIHGVHIDYLRGLKSKEFENLIFDFKVQFLISRIYFTLNSDIMNPCTPKPLISDIRGFITKCDDAIKEVNPMYNYKTKDIELCLFLSYLSFFLSYCIFLQAEDVNDESLISEFLPKIFMQCYYFISKLEDIILSESALIDCQYILLSITELLSRFTQISVGLFLRFCNDELRIPKNPIIEELALKLNGGMHVDNIAKDRFIISKIEQIIERTLSRLTKSSLVDKDKAFRLLKLWGFYLTFVRSISKISSINYANIHANIKGFNSMMENPTNCPVLTDNKGNKSNIEDLKKCPVFNHNPTGSVSMSLPGMKCPVNHSQAFPMQNTLNNMSKCPINHNKLMLRSDNSSKCPLDQTLLKRTSSSLAPIDNNAKRQKSQQISLPPIDLSRASSPVAVPQTQQIPMNYNPNFQYQPIPPPESTVVKKEDIPFDDIGLTLEFNDFEFDFDFLQNDYVMQQINENIPMDPYFQQYPN